MTKGLTTKQFFTQLNLIYFSQPAVLMIFSAVVFSLVYMGKVIVNPDPELARTMTFASGGLLVLGLAAAYFLYNSMLSKIDKSLELKKKTRRYTPAILVRSACLEVPGLFACIAFFLTGQVFLMAIPLLIVGTFIIIRPSKASMIEDLKLNAKEAASLNNPQALINESMSQ